MKKWLFMNPPTGMYIRETRCQAPVKGKVATNLRPPLDLAYMAGALSTDNNTCIIVDFPAESKGSSDLNHLVKEYDPDYVVINSTTFTLSKDLEICSSIKALKKEVIVIIKGAVFYSYMGEKIISETDSIDIAVLGDYEYAIKEISEGLPLCEVNGIIYKTNDKIIKTKARRRISLEHLPKPRRDLIIDELYLRPDTGEMQTNILISRGCSNRCIYCIAPLIGGGIARYRNVDDVIEEVEACISKGITNFYFQSDTFTEDGEWVHRFCKSIQEKKLRISWLCNTRADRLDIEIVRMMHNSGCWGLSIGIESGSQEVLNLIQKSVTIEKVEKAVEICKKEGLVILLHFMMGFPWDNKKTIKETIAFAKKLRADLTDFNVVSPLPGTKLEKIVKESKLLEGETTLDGVDYSVPVFNTFELKADELNGYRKKAYISIYSNPKYILSILKKIKTIKQLFRLIEIFLGKVVHIVKPT